MLSSFGVNIAFSNKVSVAHPIVSSLVRFHQLCYVWTLVGLLHLLSP